MPPAAPSRSPNAEAAAGILARLGRATLDAREGVQGLLRVFAGTVYYSIRGRPNLVGMLANMYEIGNRSLLFLGVVMGFIGMIFVYQAGVQTLRVVPDLTTLGATFTELLVRDLAPTLTALMLATRVGAGIAAEIGSMVVTEQVDALRMSATDPVDYLIRPRFFASIGMTLVLTVLGGAVAFTTGMLSAKVFFEVNPITYADFSLVDTADIITGATKCIAYGAAIPVVSGWCGLTTHGGSEGVGWATTRAVVNSSLAVIGLDLMISAAALALGG